MKKNLLVSSPPTVHSLNWLHGKSGGHQVVSVVSPPAHHQQTLDLPHHKDQTALRGAGDTQQGHYPVSAQSHSKTQREGCFPVGLKLQQMYCNETVLLTGPTNPKSPDRTNGISPMGTPLALTGMT